MGCYLANVGCYWATLNQSESSLRRISYVVVTGSQVGCYWAISGVSLGHTWLLLITGGLLLDHMWVVIGPHVVVTDNMWVVTRPHVGYH